MSNTQLPAVRATSQVVQFSNPKDIIDVGIALGKSAMFGATKAEDGIVIAWTCAAEGITPIDFIRTYHLIGGKPSKQALRCLAEFNQRGGKHKWIKTGDDGIEAAGEFTYDGQTHLVKYSIEDAKRCGLVRPNSNWTKTPGNMLRARVITNAIGMLCPAIVAGLMPEDFDEAPPAPLLRESQKPDIKVVDAEIISEASGGAERVRAASETVRSAGVSTPTAERCAEKSDEPIVRKEECVQLDGAQAGVREGNQTAATSPLASTPFTAQADTNGKLTVDTEKAIITAIGEQNLDALQKWLVKQTWLKPDENLSFLNTKRAQKLLDNPAGALRTIGATNLGATK